MKSSTVLRSPAALGVALLIVFGTTGCATKKYVRQTVGPVESRVGITEKQTVENSTKIADHSSAIGELENGLSRTDERTSEADRKAVAAGQEAQRAAEAAQTAQTRADEARALAESTGNQLNDVVTNLDNFQLVTTEAVLFPLNRATLNKKAKAQLDAAVGNLQTAGNYVLEVQGFTDRTGSKSANLALSQRRADAVVRYLTVQHNIPLRKINVLGVGAENYAADNRTRDGRKQNRRVEVKVFALDVRGPARAGTQASTTSTPQTNDATRSRTDNPNNVQAPAKTTVPHQQ